MPLPVPDAGIAMLAGLVNVTGPPGMVPPTGTSGVTVMVATNGVRPGFKAVNEAMLPVPLAASPIAVVVFVQFKCCGRSCTNNSYIVV